MKPFKNTEILVLRFMISSSAVPFMLGFWSWRTWVIFRLSRAVRKQLAHHSVPEARDACAVCSGQMLCLLSQNTPQQQWVWLWTGQPQVGVRDRNLVPHWGTRGSSSLGPAAAPFYIPTLDLSGC